MKLINVASTSSLRKRFCSCTVASIVTLGWYRNSYWLIYVVHFPRTELCIMNKRIGCTNWWRSHKVWRWSLQIARSDNRSISLIPNKFQFNCAKNLNQTTLRKERERKKQDFFNKGDRLNGSGTTFEKHQNTGSSLIKELYVQKKIDERTVEKRTLLRINSERSCAALKSCSLYRLDSWASVQENIRTCKVYGCLCKYLEVR